jgi:hypothetical protein
MDLFSTSYLPSFPNTHFTVPATYFTGLSNEHGQGHENFTRFLQHAQGLGVNILPLVWEPAFEVLGRDGATGRVNEGQLNAQFAFAFKRFKPDGTDPSLSEAQFRDLQYSAMIHEMTILSCPPIKNHGNIIVFIGVGFELFPATGEVWPMLIFSKFNQGDLVTYMFHAQNLEEDILLAICGEVAKGVQVLHDCSKPCIRLAQMVYLTDSDQNRCSPWRHKTREYFDSSRHRTRCHFRGAGRFRVLDFFQV